MSAPEWSDPAHVAHYRERAREDDRAVTGDEALLEQLPAGARRILDLGTGDGRLLALLLDGLPDRSATGLDSSELMLDAARERFAADSRVELLAHDLNEPLPELGCFDAVVSSLAIHHLEDARKRSLYAEAFELLEPGGLFANFEHVASPSRRLHLEFFEAIGEPLDCEDPSDRLLDVETQLRWLREIGFEDVDCHWKWRELALIAAVRPDREAGAPRPRSAVTIREAGEADWSAIWPFFRDIVRTGETIGYDREMSEGDAREMWLDGRPSRTTVAADATGAVLGSAHMHANRGGPGAHVASATFLVDPVHQGRGIGRELVGDALRWARGAGYRAMQFNAVAATNRPAVALYESLGFEIVGTVPEGFMHPREGYVGLHIMFRRL